MMERKTRGSLKESEEMSENSVDFSFLWRKHKQFESSVRSCFSRYIGSDGVSNLNPNCKQEQECNMGSRLVFLTRPVLKTALLVVER
jgi:hypothetical protein